MPRIARFVRSDTPTVYHVISRTALDGFPLGDRSGEYGDRFHIEITRSICYPSSQFLIFIRIRLFELSLSFLLHPNSGGLHMPRIARFVRSDTPTVYHVISRTALDGFPLGDREKK